jgi:hypothetical protein
MAAASERAAKRIAELEAKVAELEAKLDARDGMLIAHYDADMHEAPLTYEEEFARTLTHDLKAMLEGWGETCDVLVGPCEPRLARTCATYTRSWAEDYAARPPIVDVRLLPPTKWNGWSASIAGCFQTREGTSIREEVGGLLQRECFQQKLKETLGEKRTRDNLCVIIRGNVIVVEAPRRVVVIMTVEGKGLRRQAGAIGEDPYAAAARAERPEPVLCYVRGSW